MRGEGEVLAVGWKSGGVAAVVIAAVSMSFGVRGWGK
jgi:hypothetical protein